MKTPRQSAKSLRNEAKRVASMPTDTWLTHIGFSADEIATMQSESAARLAGLGK
jgi:hypothetical protein